MAPAFCWLAALTALLREYNAPKFSEPKLLLPLDVLPASQALTTVALIPIMAVLLSAIVAGQSASMVQQKTSVALLPGDRHGDGILINACLWRGGSGQYTSIDDQWDCDTGTDVGHGLGSAAPVG